MKLTGRMVTKLFDRCQHPVTAATYTSLAAEVAQALTTPSTRINMTHFLSIAPPPPTAMAWGPLASSLQGIAGHMDSSPSDCRNGTKMPVEGG